MGMRKPAIVLYEILRRREEKRLWVVNWPGGPGKPQMYERLLHDVPCVVDGMHHARKIGE